MKRDLSLIREILLAVEAGGISTHIVINEPKPPLDGRTPGEMGLSQTFQSSVQGAQERGVAQLLVEH